MNPLFAIRLTISSIAAFDGAHTISFLAPESRSIEIIPVIVCVLPVPGCMQFKEKLVSKQNKLKYETYRSLNQHDIIFQHVYDLIEYDKLAGVEQLPVTVGVPSHFDNRVDFLDNVFGVSHRDEFFLLWNAEKVRFVDGCFQLFGAVF